MNEDSTDLLKGTLDMLILQALEREPMHGWGVAERIESLSREVFHLQTGTVYPALHRLLKKGWITADWRVTTNNRQARYYGSRRRGGNAWKRSVLPGSASASL